MNTSGPGKSPLPRQARLISFFDLFRTHIVGVQIRCSLRINFLGIKESIQNVKRNNTETGG